MLKRSTASLRNRVTAYAYLCVPQIARCRGARHPCNPQHAVSPQQHQISTSTNSLLPVSSQPRKTTLSASFAARPSDCAEKARHHALYDAWSSSTDDRNRNDAECKCLISCLTMTATSNQRNSRTEITTPSQTS
ncbi:hypothetical protein M3J09_012526 [Ascochyta lentis]